MDLKAKQLNRIMRLAALDEKFRESLFSDLENAVRSEGISLSQASLTSLADGVKWIKTNQAAPVCMEY